MTQTGITTYYQWQLWLDDVLLINKAVHTSRHIARRRAYLFRMADVRNVLCVSTSVLSGCSLYANTSRAGAVGMIAPGGYGVAIVCVFRVKNFLTFFRTDAIASKRASRKMLS